LGKSFKKTYPQAKATVNALTFPLKCLLKWVQVQMAKYNLPSQFEMLRRCLNIKKATFWNNNSE